MYVPPVAREFSLNPTHADLTIGRTYIPHMAGLGKGLTAMTVIPVVSALLGPVVGLASAKAVVSHFR